VKLELSIADDRELRGMVRDLIKGEVTSVARGEIHSIIAEVVAQKTLPQSPAQINEMVREVIKQQIAACLGERPGPFSTKTAILMITRQEVSRYIRQLWRQRAPEVVEPGEDFGDLDNPTGPVVEGIPNPHRKLPGEG
jgi:hypothetical protein